jgi:hypothetical protein
MSGQQQCEVANLISGDDEEQVMDQQHHDQDAAVPAEVVQHSDDDVCWRERVWSALQGTPPPCSIAFTTKITDAPWLSPDISVEGMGRVSLPLSQDQAEKLAAAATGTAGPHEDQGVFQVSHSCGSQMGGSI